MEFTAHIANLGKYSAGVPVDTALSFPTTKEQVQATLREIGVDGLRYQEIIILEYSIGVSGVARALGEFARLDELNYLASRLDSLDPEELLKFTAAVEHGEYASSAEDLINLTHQKFHQAEILVGARGNEPITLKVEPRPTPSQTSLSTRPRRRGGKLCRPYQTNGWRN